MTFYKRALSLILLSFLTPCILHAQQYIFPVSNWEEIKPKTLVNTTFETLLVSGWDKSFDKVISAFPNGLIRKGNSKTNTASTYHLMVYFTELELNANVIIHKSPHNPDSFPVKSVSIVINEKENYHTTIERIKKYLEDKFPNGGPFLKGDTQIGYVIPNHQNCGYIISKWGEPKKTNNEVLRINIQCHK